MVEVGCCLDVVWMLFGVTFLHSPFFSQSPSSLIVGFVWKVCMFLVDLYVYLGLNAGSGFPGFHSKSHLIFHIVFLTFFSSFLPPFRITF